MKKHLLLILVALFSLCMKSEAALSVQDSAFSGDSGTNIIASGTCGYSGKNLKWTLDSDGKLTISGTGKMSNTAPWSSYSASIKSVEILEGVTSIGNSTFQDCSGLTSIQLPSTVTNIGFRAFKNCSGLTSISIPSTVTSIDANAFDGCSGLTSISIPEGVTSIGNSAFSGCSSLTSISIPEGVTSIGNMAFSGCSSLTSISIPEGVTSIGNSAFSGCSSLTSISIPEGVTSIGYGAFYYCSGLVSISIPEGVTSIGNSAFSGCSSLTSISIPEGVTSIGNMAFQDCSGLTSIQLPSTVTNIGFRAFKNCSGLTSISIPSTVTSIDANAFDGCSGLTSISIPEGVTSIGNSAFSGCSSLTSISIPEGVTSIGNMAFYHCSSLTSISIPEGVTSIGDKAFTNCSSLTSISIPEGVTSISDGAFWGCSSLTSISIPEGVTSIGIHALCGCSSLTSISLPEGVTSIGDMAFLGCSHLTSIVCHNPIPPSCGSDIFNNIGKNCVLQVPASAVDTYKQTSPWNKIPSIEAILTRVTIADGEMESFEKNSDEQVDLLTYTRTLNNTEWNALFLPFEIPVCQLTEKYEVAYINAIHSYDEDDNGEIDRMSMEVIKLREGTLHANHPYLIKARTTAAKQMSITVENTTLYKAESRTLDCSSVYTKFEITGIYEKMTSAQLAGCYALSGGSWKNLASGSSLNPFRLYLRVSSREGSPVKLSEAALARIGIHVQGEETATSVEERLMQKQHKTDAVYDLSGRRVTLPKKGQTYIVNGKKRMY